MSELGKVAVLMGEPDAVPKSGRCGRVKQPPIDGTRASGTRKANE